MMTGKWGPAGWCFLEGVAQSFPSKPTPDQIDHYVLFFIHLPNILPCVYCRQSLRYFQSQLPIRPWMKSRRSLTYYVYLIHNLVNDKLRQQGLLDAENPPFQSVESRIRQTYRESETWPSCLWDFLYAIVFNYPSEPTKLDKYNYWTFFQSLGWVLPGGSIRDRYQTELNRNFSKPILKSRDSLTQWFYDIQQKITKSDITKFDNYQTVCQKYEGFRANCKTSCRVPAKLSSK
jgi:hypothetical protein